MNTPSGSALHCTACTQQDVGYTSANEQFVMEWPIAQIDYISADERIMLLECGCHDVQTLLDHLSAHRGGIHHPRTFSLIKLDKFPSTLAFLEREGINIKYTGNSEE